MVLAARASSRALATASAADAGVLTAEAREEGGSRRLSTCTVRVTDEAGTLVALFTGTAFRKDDPAPLPAAPGGAGAGR